MKLSNKMNLIRLIAHTKLSTNAKTVGVIIALAVVENRNFTRLARETIKQRSGLSGGALGRAILELEESCLMYRVRTGRATIWYFNEVVLKSREYSGMTSCGQTDCPPQVKRNSSICKSVLHELPQESEFFGSEDDKCKAWDKKNRSG